MVPERRSSHKTNREASQTRYHEYVAALIGFVCLVLMFLWVHFQNNKLNTEQRSLGNVYTFAVESCTRLNILRAEDNISHLADFRVYQVVYLESLPNLKHETGQRLADSERFLAQLKTALNEKEWTPLTNCRKAVNELGIRYSPPSPIPFERKLPSRKDLTIPNTNAA